MKFLNKYFSTKRIYLFAMVGKKNNFIFFLMVVFLFISSNTLALSNGFNPVQRLIGSPVQQSKVFPPVPVLGVNTSFPILSAQGALAIDLNSGVPLYEKNADAPLLPASTTKIITALVSLDSYKLDQILVIPSGVNVEGQKMGLYQNEQMTFENLLYGLLVYSANDAAETLAKSYPGGYDAFISAMNSKAKDLSMTNSHFENPIGLDGNGQRTTVRDLSRASEVAMHIPEFAKIVGTKEITVTDTTGKFVYNLKNVNQLLGNVPGVMGVKTGWTESARENLVTYLERNGHTIMIVILGSQDRFGETKELIDWIFNNYNWNAVSVPQSSG
jgi:D-alanyl-D-alanine carboxypeptidase